MHFGKTLAQILRERRVTVRGRTPIIPPETSGRWFRPSTKESVNWVDLVRTAIAAFLLGHLWAAQRPTTATELDTELIAGALCAIGTLVQTFRFLRIRSVTIISPVYYASALAFAVVDPIVSAFVVAFTWTFTLVAQKGLVFIPVMSITLGAAIYITDGMAVGPLIFAGSLMTGPVVAVLLQRAPVIACRIHY